MEGIDFLSSLTEYSGSDIVTFFRSTDFSVIHDDYGYNSGQEYPTTEEWERWSFYNGEEEDYAGPPISIVMSFEYAKKNFPEVVGDYYLRSLGIDMSDVQ